MADGGTNEGIEGGGMISEIYASAARIRHTLSRSVALPSPGLECSPRKKAPEAFCFGYTRRRRSKLGVELGTRQVSNWPMFFTRLLTDSAADLCLWAPNPNLLPEKAWIERASG